MQWLLMDFACLRFSLKCCTGCSWCFQKVWLFNCVIKAHSSYVSITSCTWCQSGCFWFPLQWHCKAVRWGFYDRWLYWSLVPSMQSVMLWLPTCRAEGHVSSFAGMWMPWRQLPQAHLIKQHISLCRYLIVQPAPLSLATPGLTETGSHNSREAAGTVLSG